MRTELKRKAEISKAEAKLYINSRKMGACMRVNINNVIHLTANGFGNLLKLLLVDKK